jgi:hypothetical protein
VRSQGGVKGCSFYRAPQGRLFILSHTTGRRSAATARRAGRARGALRATLVLLPAALPSDAQPAGGRRRKALGPPHLRAFRDARLVARRPQLWGLVLWCLAHCASTGISLAMAVGLALVSHRNFQVRNGHRCQRDHRDAVWNAYGARTIGALSCSIACARGGIHDIQESPICCRRGQEGRALSDVLKLER